MADELKTDLSSGTWRRDEEGRVTIKDQQGREKVLVGFGNLIFFEGAELRLTLRAEMTRKFAAGTTEDVPLPNPELIKRRTIRGFAVLQYNNSFAILSEDGHVRRNNNNKIDVTIEDGEKSSAFLIVHHNYERKYGDYKKQENFDAFLSITLPYKEFNDIWDLVRLNNSESRLFGSVGVGSLGDEIHRYAPSLDYHTFYFEEGKCAAAYSCTINVYQKEVTAPEAERPQGESSSVEQQRKALDARLNEVMSLLEAIGQNGKKLFTPLNLIIGLITLDILTRLFR